MTFLNEEEIRKSGNEFMNYHNKKQYFHHKSLSIIFLLMSYSRIENALRMILTNHNEDRNLIIIGDIIDQV